jgi:glutamate/tyrosine decarboxylase-like PLP-dependent enzyme
MNIDLAPANVRLSSPLFPESADRRYWDDFLTVALDEALRRIPEGRVSPEVDMADFRQSLHRFDFTTPQPMSDLLPWVIGQLEHGLVHLTHPRYFGLFNPSPTFPAECADRIAAAFNPQLATATTSPVAVEMEAHVIRAIASRAGFASDAAGHFTSGGSEANATALTCALTSANGRFAADGIRAFSGAPVLYVSREAHLAWYKIAHQAGVGRSAVHLVDTDGSGRMDKRALADAIATDRSQGCVPVMIVATAGTTGAGMIDPLSDCAEIARASNIWLHVDAAWGGALIASDRLCGALAGMEAADSVTIDAHKWLAATMACGMFITNHPEILPRAFHVTHEAASYMPSNNRRHDPYVSSAQWSRRFLGLRLFLSLAAAGWRGLAEHIERSVHLTALLKAELVAGGWTIVNDSAMAVLCADPPAGFPSARSIAGSVVASGLAWVAATSFCGREVVRICVTNGKTTPQDIRFLAHLLQNSAHQWPA